MTDISEVICAFTHHHALVGSDEERLDKCLQGNDSSRAFLTFIYDHHLMEFVHIGGIYWANKERFLSFMENFQEGKFHFIPISFGQAPEMLVVSETPRGYTMEEFHQELRFRMAEWWVMWINTGRRQLSNMALHSGLVTAQTVEDWLSGEER